MSKFQKVSELEWYLHMEAFHKAFGVHSGINGQNHTMDLKEFHDFWTDLRAPGYNKHRNEVILNAPFNINFFLYPTQAIEIPLGFSLPEDFEIIQGKKDNYIHRERSYSCQRSYYVGDVRKEDIKAKYENGMLNVTIPKEAPKQENQHFIEIE